MTIDATLAGIVGPSAGLGQTAPQPTAPAAPEDVGAFDAALAMPVPSQQPPVPVPVEPSVGLAPATPPAVENAPPLTIGQAILDGMNGLRNQFDASSDGIAAALEKASQSSNLADMVAVQMQVSTLSIQQELMGKIAGKATQNMDQLLRAQ